MTMKNVKNNLVGHALIWAAMMISISLITKGSEKSFHILLIMIAGWCATHMLVTGSKAFWRAECEAIRGLMISSKSRE